MNNKRIGFATRMGAIAATVGSAVGLGNIWRFPYEAGQNGGGAFIIVYIGCVLLLGIPVMLSEFIIGRSTHQNMKGALRTLAPKSKFYLLSYVCVLGALLTLSFYSVVCGWVMEYLSLAAMGHLSGHTPQEYTTIFNSFVGSPSAGLVWTLVFLAINFAVLLRGVQKGIERISSIMMPLLFVLLIVFCVRSLFLPGASRGFAFLFNVDFSQLGWRGVVDAFGQAFMSLSLGVACLVTYSSYFDDKTSLSRDAFTVAGLDTLVALLAGVMIFPAVFSFGMQPEAGPKLVFEILPSVFEQMTGGYLWAVLFFLLLFFASLTSTISLSEINIKLLMEEHSLSRSKATWITALIVVALASLCALSFNVLSGVTAFGMNIFDLFNYLAGNVFMLLGGLATAVFVGWMVDRTIIRRQLMHGGRPALGVERYLRFCLRYVAPVAILLIFLQLTGIL